MRNSFAPSAYIIVADPRYDKLEAVAASLFEKTFIGFVFYSCLTTK
jgi:hypothetical protein